jgi:hypothetical protein
MLADHMGFPHWKIVENRFDAFDEGDKHRVFVSFRNAGVIVWDSPTSHYFPDQAIKALRFVFAQEAFGDPILVSRFGVRSRFATAFDGDYQELLEGFTTQLFSLSPQAETAIHAQLTDIAAPLNFEDNHGKINILSGPLTKEELGRAFNLEEDDLPPASFYLDIDYWYTPNQLINAKDIYSKIKLFAEENWNRFSELSQLIIGWKR